MTAQTALRAELPPEFLEDMRERHPSVVAHLPPSPVVFDVFLSWRLDSGSYLDMAEVVMSAWESRCSSLAPGDAKPPPPQLMHSNLGDVEEVLEVCRCGATTLLCHRDAWHLPLCSYAPGCKVWCHAHSGCSSAILYGIQMLRYGVTECGKVDLQRHQPSCIVWRLC